MKPSRDYPVAEIAKTVMGVSSLSYMFRHGAVQDPLRSFKAEPFMFSKSSATLGTLQSDGFRWVGSSFFAIKEAIRSWRDVLRTQSGSGITMVHGKMDMWKIELARGFKN